MATTMRRALFWNYTVFQRDLVFFLEHGASSLIVDIARGRIWTSFDCILWCTVHCLMEGVGYRRSECRNAEIDKKGISNMGPYGVRY